MNSTNQVSSRHSIEIFACPSDYTPSRFFTRYCKQYVAPIYHMHLSEVARTTGADVVQLWGWTFDRLADKLGLKRDADDFGSYVAQRREGTIPCAASKVSEVYKSAYLRVLEALWFAKLVDEASYRALSAIVCPVDFSFWDIGVVDRPAWWPKASAKMKDLQVDDDWLMTQALTALEIDSKQLIFASGPCSAPDDDLTSRRFTVIPFGYRVNGPRLPTAERIAQLLFRPAWSLNVMKREQLSFFETPLSEWEPSGQEGLRIGDLLVVPLLARIESTNINCWQYWRGINPLRFPTVPLASGTVAVGSNDWSLEVNGRRVFSGYNWTEGPMQRLRFQFDDTGQFATVERNWLQSALAEHSLKLAFVLTHEYRIRKSEYSDDHEESTFAKLINFSTLIIG